MHVPVCMCIFGGVGNALFFFSFKTMKYDPLQSDFVTKMLSAVARFWIIRDARIRNSIVEGG